MPESENAILIRSLPLRDRITVLSALAGATVLAWIYLVDMAVGMDGMDGMMVLTSPRIGAGLLIGAGLYQMTPMKDACLRHCRSPAQFISRSWKPGAFGAFRMGLEHGAFCLGCCWILMGLLFFGGVMSLLWIAGITVFVLLEKVLPFGHVAGRVAGGVMVLGGIVFVVSWTP